MFAYKPAHLRHYSRDGLRRHLVLPDAQHAPAPAPQYARLFRVARPVGRDLLAPPSAVRLRHAEVPRATVPETAVDEDADSGAWKHDVGRATKIGFGPRVCLEAEPIGPQGRSEKALRGRDPADIRLHDAPRRRGRCGGGSRADGEPRPHGTILFVGVLWHLVHDVFDLCRLRLHPRHRKLLAVHTDGQQVVGHREDDLRHLIG